MCCIMPMSTNMSYTISIFKVYFKTINTDVVNTTNAVMLLAVMKGLCEQCGQEARCVENSFPHFVQQAKDMAYYLFLFGAFYLNQFVNCMV